VRRSFSGGGRRSREWKEVKVESREKKTVQKEFDMKKTMIPTVAAGLLILGLGCNRETSDSSGSAGQNVSATSRGSDAPSEVYSASGASGNADNTGRNVRDRSDAAVTAQDQAANASDREIARRIRRDLTGNDQFSTTAKNIKIVSDNGKVTLRGPVKSDQERQPLGTSLRRLLG